MNITTVLLTVFGVAALIGIIAVIIVEAARPK